MAAKEHKDRKGEPDHFPACSLSPFPPFTFVLFLLLSLSALLVLAPAVPAATADNPYLSTITNRNVFSLKPPPDPASLVPQAPPPPVPVIKLAGITTILGGKLAILRVPRPARPPVPASEISLMLAEGAPAEEGVKVLAIDVAAATVRIDNNGVVQTLDMDKDAPKSAPAPAAAPGIPAPPQPGGAIPVPPSAAPAGGVANVPRPVRGAGPMASAGASAANPGGIPGAGPSGIAAPPPEQPMSMGEQEVLIELQKEQQPDLPWPPTAIGQEFQNEQQAEQGGTPALPL